MPAKNYKQELKIPEAYIQVANYKAALALFEGW
jgi:hypothetical protein